MAYVLEVDWDNDGDFDEDFELMNPFVYQESVIETITGRDYASQVAGRASPGQLRVTLNNDDDRFSRFNTESPLYGLALPGRKVRLRSSDSTPIDPVVLARDRFRRSDGALGDTENELTWAHAVAGEWPIPAPTYQAVGTPAGGTGNVTPTWPTHERYDVGLLFVETVNGEVPSAPTDWNAVAAVDTGAVTNGTRITAFWRRAESAAETNPEVTDPGDHAYAVIVTFRGCKRTGNPWDAIDGVNKTTASTSVTFDAVTTTGANRLIVLAASRGNDSASAAFSAWTNANLESVDERHDAGTSSGNGGGIGVATGAKAAAGSTGTTTATVTSSVNGLLTISLAPETPSWSIEANKAVGFAEETSTLAYVDLGVADYYAHVNVSEGAFENRVGLLYRYEDEDNYSVWAIDGESLSCIALDIVAGVTSVAFSEAVEVRNGITLGVYVVDDDVTFYIDGVAVGEATALQTSATKAGLYGDWNTGADRPAIKDFAAYAALVKEGEEPEGVLWTGELDDVVPSVRHGELKTATLTAFGPLSKMGMTVTPSVALAGRETGFLVGSILSEAGLMNPPGPIHRGDVTTGGYIVRAASALQLARRLEAIELGFLHETPEGSVAYHSRTHRDNSTSMAIFSQNSAIPNALRYIDIAPADWRREIFNRVSASTSPYSQGEEATLVTFPGPYALSMGQSVELTATYSGLVARWTGHTRDVLLPSAPTGVTWVAAQLKYPQSTTVAINMPATVSAGDLLIVMGTHQGGSLIASGWTNTKTGNAQIVTKVAAGTEGGTSVNFSATFGASGLYFVGRVQGFYGGSGSAIAVSQNAPGNTSSWVDGTSGVASDSPDPYSLSVPWGSLPTLFIAWFESWDLNSFNIAAKTLDTIPTGYGSSQYADIEAVSGQLRYRVGLASRIASASNENPSTFVLSNTVHRASAWTVAIRGTGTGDNISRGAPAGNNGNFTISYLNETGGDVQQHQNIVVTGIPVIEGDTETVTVEDRASQDAYGLRDFPVPAELFATGEDAREFCNLVIEQSAQPKPVVKLRFFAGMDEDHMEQALQRRVGDRITVDATGTVGLGILQDFYIESIRHEIQNLGTMHFVEWQLSSAGPIDLSGILQYSIGNGDDAVTEVLE